MGDSGWMRCTRWFRPYRCAFASTWISAIFWCSLWFTMHTLDRNWVYIVQFPHRCNVLTTNSKKKTQRADLILNFSLFFMIRISRYQFLSLELDEGRHNLVQNTFGKFWGGPEASPLNSQVAYNRNWELSKQQMYCTASFFGWKMNVCCLSRNFITHLLRVLWPHSTLFAVSQNGVMAFSIL